MKRNIFKYLLMLTVFAGIFTSCQKRIETEGKTDKLTYYPKFDFKGDATVIHKIGSAFTDPGVTASENGADIAVKVAVKGLYTGYSGETVGTDADKYSVTYSAVNGDGFSGTRSRTVYVSGSGDFATSIEGVYTCTVYRDGGTSEQYTDMPYLTVTKVSDNVFSISDASGAYYDLGRGYGNAYRSVGLQVTANDMGANDFTISQQPSGVGAFGGDLVVSDFSIDAAAKTIYYKSSWSFGYVFEATLTQVSF